MNKIKLAYIMTAFDGSHIKYKFGIGYFITKSLKEQGAEITFVEGFKVPFRLYFKAKSFLYRYILKKKYFRSREPFILKKQAKKASELINKLDIDAVFSFGSLPLAYIETRKPVFFWADATFAGLVNYNPEFMNLCNEIIIKGNRNEQIALDNCRNAIFASDWAASSAINNYNVDKSKIKIVELGANMESDLTEEEVSGIIDSRSCNACNLLFIGTRWDLKGGDMALEVAKLLNQNGLDTTLHVIGIKPEIDQPYPDYLKCWGYINKSSDEGRQLLYKLIAHSHFLILPTKAEAFGHVFCEANSFGVPCLAPRTGGVTTVIKNNVNGFLFPVDSEPRAYCEFIVETLKDNEKYRQLALSSYKEYKTRLNWRVAAEKVMDLIRREIG